MVVIGGFSVELVEAETKQPFREHMSMNGACYAEVEPGTEYYMKVAVLDEQALSKKGCSEALITFAVDGIDLGYNALMCPSDGQVFWGSDQCKNGISTRTALRFATPRVCRETQTGIGPASTATMMGTVTVKFNVPIFVSMSTDVKDRQGTVLSSQPEVVVPGNTGHFQGTKSVRSAQGSFSETFVSSNKRRFLKGAPIETITIKYCTAVGLIHAGVLPQPPLWEDARMKNPQRGPVDPKILSIQSKKVTVDAVFQDGVCLTQAKEYEIYDLMHLDDD